MSAKTLKFAAGIVILLGTITWLAKAGYDEGKAYYWTTDEVMDKGAQAYGKRIMLMGDLVPGSIHHVDGRMNFDLVLNDDTIPVVYEGTAQIPDTFKEGKNIKALVEGRMDPSGHFVGRRIQAKCASKYESDPSAAYQPPIASAAPRNP